MSKPNKIGKYYKRVEVRRADVSFTHPLVERTFELIAENQISLTALGEKAGVDRNVIAMWRERHLPKLDLLNAVLGVLGYELYIKPIGGGRPRKDET